MLTTIKESSKEHTVTSPIKSRTTGGLGFAQYAMVTGHLIHDVKGYRKASVCKYSPDELIAKQ